MRQGTPSRARCDGRRGHGRSDRREDGRPKQDGGPEDKDSAAVGCAGHGGLQGVSTGEASDRTKRLMLASGADGLSAIRRQTVDRPLDHGPETGQDGSMLTFGVLGPLEVRAGDEEIAVPGPRLRTLLALLLVEPGRVVATAQLSEALWGRDPPAVATKTVQTYLSRLRRSLEADGARVMIVTRAPGYRLQVDPEAIDAVRFARLAHAGRAALDANRPVEAAEALREALALWRGDAYAEFTDQLALRIEADRLEELRRITHEDFIDAELGMGAGPELVPGLEKVLAADPHRERGWGQLMIALYRAGRQADALATFRRARTALIDGLGVEPSTQLRDLHARVLAQDPALLGRAWPSIRADPTSREIPPTENPVAGVPAHRVPTDRAPGDLERSGRPNAERATFLRGTFRRRAARRRLSVGAGLAAALVAGAAIVATAGSHSTATRLTALPANSVGELGPAGAILGATAVGTDPTGVAYGGGLLWVANNSDGTVFAVDPASHEVVQRIQVGGAPEAIVTTANDVWVANSQGGTVDRINIAARRQVETIAVGTRPDALASGPSGVWVTNSGANTIQRIDPATGLSGDPIDVGDGPDGVAVDGTTVWVANGRDGTVSRIDTRTGGPVASPVPVGSGPRSIVLNSQAVWVANEFSHDITRIDRSTGRTHTIEVGDGPQSIAAVGSTLWVTNRFDGTLSRIDERSERVTTETVGSSPRGLAVLGDHVWVASGPLDTTAHRGGTITVASDVLPGDEEVEGVDPASAYLIPTIGPQRLVYDGLVEFRPADEVLVPDLAERIPVPADGGRTYTFTLRRGIRYSTGGTVRVADFVRGVKRALLTKGGRPDFFAGILGAKACTRDPRHCDLSRGVIVDDEVRSITFHLAVADPEFLAKLTWFVFPAPPGTPLTKVHSPLPGTGPYRIAAFTQSKVYRLERNHWFHEWSYAAQPDGYADVITWMKVASAKAAAAAVIAGLADLAPLTTLTDRRSSQLIEDLRRRYPLELHSDPFWGTTYEVLDNREPPFNDVRARQALNYATDRRKLVDLYGGPSMATATCQLLPPGFPSYQWYCPYTNGPRDGRYHGPDMAKARRLVQESGTAGMRVTIYTVRGTFGPPFDDYFATVLAELGYRVTVRRLPNTQASGDFLYDRRNHIQVMSYLWGADFPLASNFYGGTIACAYSPTGFCDRTLDARAAAAAGLQASDPGAALRAWTGVDWAVTDAAAAVPGVTWRDWYFVSAHVGNYQSSASNGTAFSQLWVR